MRASSSVGSFLIILSAFFICFGIYRCDFMLGISFFVGEMGWLNGVHSSFSSAILF